jgi:hypothetical protein
MVWFIISIFLAVLATWLTIKVKNEKTKQKEMRNSHYQELEAIKEIQKASMEAAAAAYDEKVLQISESYQHQIEKLMMENETIRKNYLNQGEILTHQILEHMKTTFIQERIILPDEMIIMPNIYIPEGNGKKRQIDHVILLPTGIYVIETKHWKGHIVLGLTRMGSHKFSFLANLLDDEKQEAVIFDKNKLGELTVKTCENPLGEIQNTTVILSNYLKSQEIKTWITPLLFFNHEESEVHDWSDNSIVTRICNKEQLQHFFFQELTTKERIYGAFQLKNIEHCMEIANYCTTVEENSIKM